MQRKPRQEGGETRQPRGSQNCEVSGPFEHFLEGLGCPGLCRWKGLQEQRAERAVMSGGQNSGAVGGGFWLEVWVGREARLGRGENAECWEGLLLSPGPGDVCTALESSYLGQSNQRQQPQNLTQEPGWHWPHLKVALGNRDCGENRPGHECIPGC